MSIDMQKGPVVVEVAHNVLIPDLVEQRCGGHVSIVWHGVGWRNTTASITQSDKRKTRVSPTNLPRIVDPGHAVHTEPLEIT